MQLKKFLLLILCLFIVAEPIHMHAGPKEREHRNKAITYGIGAALSGCLTACALYNCGKSLGVFGLDNFITSWYGNGTELDGGQSLLNGLKLSATGTAALFSTPIAIFCTYRGYKHYKNYMDYKNQYRATQK